MNLTITKRLSFGFGVLVLSTLIFGGVSIIKMQDMFDSTTRLYNHPYTVSNAIRDIRASIYRIQIALKTIEQAENPAEIQQASAQINRYEEEAIALFNVVFERFLGDMQQAHNLHQQFIGWKSVRNEVIALALKGEHEQAAEVNRGKAAEYVSTMATGAQHIVNFAENKANTFYQNAVAAKDQVMTASYISLTVIGLFGILLSYFIVKSITVPLSNIVRHLGIISIGDLTDPPEIDRKDEIGQVATSLNELVSVMKETAGQADRIASGDYSAEISPKSDRDTLGFAMRAMTRKLAQVSSENEKKDWLDKGQVTLFDQLRGDLSFEELSKRIITFLADYLKAPIGALYVAKEDGLLCLQATYAHTVRKNLSNRYRLGEGLVGQAALEKKPILITQCPADYIRIESGLGDAPPNNILVYPLLLNDAVKGIIELGTFSPLSETQIALISLVQEGIAITLDSVESRARTARLLDQTQEQAEALQAREEELQQINEELRVKTEILQESEMKLQSQQEELEQTNEELEEQAGLLEEQKESIERQNHELMEARRLLEEKAKALEVTGKYKSEFLANMSHELRTPLNSILLLSKLLMDNKDANLTEDHVTSMQAIYTSGRDLLALINDVLDLSKVESGKMEMHITDFSLSEFACALRDYFQPSAEEKGIMMDLTLSESLPDTIRTDRRRLEQILRNFISNALKFTDNGKVSIRIQRPDTTGYDIRELRDMALDPAHVLSFSVQDTGIGIPSEKQQIIFEAFQQADGTTSRKYGGTGLGLSISRELAKVLGGKIGLKSVAGEGSTFTLYLPERYQEKTGGLPEPSRPDEQPLRLTEQPSPASVPMPKTISTVEAIADDRNHILPTDKSLLIIEDDPHFLKILRDLSREQGFKCLVAGDGETGLHFAEYYKPSAIVLDIGLPGIDGWTVMTRLKENLDTRHIPVHFISASDKKFEALKMGAVDFLTKPVNPESLNQMYEKLNLIISKPVKDLLVVEDDPAQQQAISKLIGNGDVRITAAITAGEAFEHLSSGQFDCMILDLGLPDFSGVELIRRIKSHEKTCHVPIIVYTGRELTPEETAIINQYTESTVIKGVDSHQKLLDETTLFLHRVEKQLPEAQRKALRLMHDKEMVFNEKTILVVDDDMRNVFSLKKLLEDKQMKVVVGKNGKEGLARLNAHPEVSLVLMDIMMPEMDGYAAMREIRKDQKHKRLPIIALTAKAMKGDRAKCIEAGASDYLSKPVDADRLLSVMRVWLYGKA